MSTAVAEQATTETSEAAAAAAETSGGDAASSASATTPESQTATLTTEAKVETKTEAATETKAADEVKYELKLPEQSPLDATALERTVATARALGLSAEQGQTLADALHAEAVAVAKATNDALIAAYQPGGAEWAKQEAAWRAEALADAEIGGTPEKLAQSVEYAKRFLAKYGDDGLAEALTASGLGSNPKVVRALARAGKAMGEGSRVEPGSQGGSPKSAADVLYGGQPLPNAQ